MSPVVLLPATASNPWPKRARDIFIALVRELIAAAPQLIPGTSAVAHRKSTFLLRRQTFHFQRKDVPGRPLDSCVWKRTSSLRRQIASLYAKEAPRIAAGRVTVSRLLTYDLI